MVIGEERKNKHCLLHSAIVMNALNNPNEVAIKYFSNQYHPSICEIIEITYGEFLEKCILVADYLIKQGLEKGDGVAISLPRGIEQICSVVATLLAGGFYVPVSLHQPLNRRISMIEKADLKYQICFKGQANEAAHIIDAELAMAPRESATIDNIVMNDNDGSDTAYVIFTSGSTGEPKGVEIAHSAANNTIEAINALEAVGPGDCILGISALDFDLSVYDIFGVLGAGGTLALLPENLYKDAYGWKSAIERMDVTIWNSVPALFEMLIEASEKKQVYEKIRSVMLSGDWIGLSIPERMKRYFPNARLLAMGGGTEASIWSNYFYVDEVMPDWVSIPYGHALPNQKYRIVENGLVCPPGEEGEIQIGGQGVAKSYIGQPELSKESFIIDGHERWYRTGDRGVIDDGIIWFRGRLDHQVKVKGHRIELAEVEHQLNFCKDWKAKALVASYADSPHLVCAMARIKKQVAKKEMPINDKCIMRYGNQTIIEFVKDLVNCIEEKEIAVSPILLDYWKAFIARNHQIDLRPSLISEDDIKKKKKLILDVLTGKKEAVVLLSDNTLAPEQIMKKDEILMNIVNRLEADLASQMPCRVAFLCCRTGVVVNELAKKLITSGFEVSAIDMGPYFINEMIKNLNGKIGGAVIGTDYHVNLPDAYLNAFDMVISVNGLHSFAALGKGTFVAHQLLKNGGRLLALEYAEMPPEALLSAGIIEDCFREYDCGRNDRQSPLLAKHEWENELTAMGFTAIDIKLEDHVQTIKAMRDLDFHSFTTEKWQIAASKQLPDYMVPDQIIAIHELPLSKNGKVDVKRLASYFQFKKEENGRSLDDPMEFLIAEIWSELLGIEQIYQESSFFTLGGDSLLATRFLAQLRSKHNIEISMNMLFETPVLKDLAQVLDSLNEDDEMEEGEI